MLGAVADAVQEARVVPGVLAEDADAAAGGQELPGDQLDQRRLARAVGSQQPVHPRLEAHAEVVDPDHDPVQLGQRLELEQRLHQILVGASTRRSSRATEPADSSSSHPPASSGGLAGGQGLGHLAQGPRAAPGRTPGPRRRTAPAAAFARLCGKESRKVQALSRSPRVSCRIWWAMGPNRHTTNQVAVAKRGWRVSDDRASTTSAAGTMVPREDSTTASATGAVWTTVSREGENRIESRYSVERGQQGHQRQQHHQHPGLADHVVEPGHRPREVDQEGARAQVAGHQRRPGDGGHQPRHQQLGDKVPKEANTMAQTASRITLGSGVQLRDQPAPQELARDLVEGRLGIAARVGHAPR